MKIALCIVTVPEVVLAFLEFITGKVLMGDRLLGCMMFDLVRLSL